MQHQPTALDCEIQAGLVFVRRALLAVQEWPVDQLDVDPAILAGLDAVGNFNDLASGPFRIRVGPVRDEAASVGGLFSHTGAYLMQMAGYIENAETPETA